MAYTHIARNHSHVLTEVLDGRDWPPPQATCPKYLASMPPR